MLHGQTSSRRMPESSKPIAISLLYQARQWQLNSSALKAAFQSSMFVRPKRSTHKVYICASAGRTEQENITPSTVNNLVRRRGYVVNNNSIGPFLNLSLTSTTNPNQLAIISGILLPNRLHIESYRTLQSQIQKSLLYVSPGMMVFIAALAIASQKGIKWVYGLAIEDDPRQHRRLLRYLKRFGGQYVMTVGEDLSSVPARIFYGGFGTVIRGQVDHMLQRGIGMMQRTSQAEQVSE